MGGGVHKCRRCYGSTELTLSVRQDGSNTPRAVALTSSMGIAPRCYLGVCTGGSGEWELWEMSVFGGGVGL